LLFVFARNRKVTLAPVIVPKNANDSLVNCRFKRPLNRIENTDNTRIIDAVICAILVDMQILYNYANISSFMRLKFEITPRNNEELELLRRIIDEIGKQNILEKR